MEEISSASWYCITQDEYNHIPIYQKISNKIFYIKDTGQIYRGNKLFTGSVVLCKEFPVNPVVEKLYFNTETSEGKVYNGKTWVDVIKPITVSNKVEKDGTDPVSSGAVYKYIEEVLEAIENGAY